MRGFMFLAVILAASPAQWLGPKPEATITRLITIAPSLTETVLALGATDTLIGVSRFDEAPAVQSLPRVGGFVDPSIETVLKLKPQLVVVQKSPGNQKPIEKLAELGVPVLALSLTTLADASEAMRVLGVVLKREGRATELINELEAARAKERSLAPKGARLQVLFVYGFSPLVVAGPGSFADELLRDCGVQNVARPAATAYPVWSREQLVAMPPQVVVDASDSADGRDALKALTSKSRWVALENKALMHPGPALAQALGPLCASLRGAPSPSLPGQ
jgi:iron complex transport system substrate-binding protein